ncbi:probable ubiquitin carboxyl-terminal hydrolase creB [Cyprinodon tularosa]|uniref:probable ubiquitin carboxyl-terminal hydrolase creB n=1 Tax=Cyprinodon tularosa TaxID=77115 RepID=UPI0018E2141C|nr:probable ubiquitin carboxyl-terminal hydrolase creB [Cyprinodon tularosa]
MPNKTEVTYYGLINQGSTCYLNSILQVLFMTKEFREAVNRSVEENSSQKIGHHLKDLFEDLQIKQTNTSKIIKALDIQNVYEQQDAAEYFEKVLRATSYQASKIFQGELNHVTICKVCDQPTDSIGPFWHLPLELLDSKEIYSVENGIKNFFEPTVFNGDNQMYCENCDIKVDASRQYVINRYPDVLLLLLKRFDFSYKYMSYVKINCNVDFPYELHIPENQTYELYSVVDHSGDLRSGHYYAKIKSQDEGNTWYCFDDTWVSPTELKNCPGKENIARSSSAYLLFYRRKGQDSEEMQQTQNDTLSGPNVHQTKKSLDLDNRDPKTNNMEIENTRWRENRYENSTKEKERDTPDFRPKPKENLAVHVYGTTDKSRDEDEKIDGDDKHITENAEGKAIQKTNSDEQEETQLSGDLNTQKSVRDQSEINDANPNEKQQTWEIDDNTNTLMTGKKADNVSLSDQGKESKQTDGKHEALKTDEYHNTSDEDSNETTFKENGEAPVTGCHHNSVGDVESKENKSEHAHIDHSASYKDQAQKNENVYTDTTGWQKRLDTEHEETSKLLMAQSHQDKRTPHQKKRNTEEDNGPEEEHCLKTHTKCRDDEDVEDCHRQSGTWTKKRQRGEKAAGKEKERSIKNPVQVSAGGRHSSRKSANVPEVSSGSISGENKRSRGKESKVLQYMTEERVHIISEDNQKTTTSMAASKAKKHAMTQPKEKETTLNVELQVAEGNLNLKRSNPHLLCFPVSKKHIKKDRGKKSKNKISKFMCFSTTENGDSD